MTTVDPTTAGLPPAEEVLAELRAEPVNRHLFGGFGPLVAALVLLVSMILLAPSVAPERVVERPVSSTTTTEVEP